MIANRFVTRLLLMIIPCLLASSSQSQPLNLVQNQKTTYSIVLANDAIPSEANAAQLLQKYLKQIAGADFPIIDESKARDDLPHIWVGAGTGARQLLPQQNWAELTSDSIVIKTTGDQLILAGGRPRGALYAVYQFLEDDLGCRWWSTTEQTIPRTNNLTVSPKEVVYAPPLEYRDFSKPRSTRYDPKYAEIGISLRSNGLNNLPDAEWGGRMKFRGFIHSFSELLPVKKYFKEHPEWYSDPANGYKPATAQSPVPSDTKVQLCYSAPGLEEELTKNAIAWIKQDPNLDYLSLSINDNRGYCRDSESLELAEREGSQSAPLIQFVNRVSRKLREIKPDIKIVTLAYYHTIVPPKTLRPDDNVYIFFAPITVNTGFPLNDKMNKDTRDNLAGWNKITNRVMVWNYVGNFFYPMLPYPNWDSIGRDIQQLSSMGVLGIFCEGPLSQGDLLSDFQEMRAWMIGHLLWDPHKKPQDLMDQFLEGYYGSAAPYLRQHIQNVQKGFYNQNQPLRAFNFQFEFLNLEVLNRSTDLFDLAEKAVQDNPIFLKRVMHERLAIDLAWLHRYDVLKKESEYKKKPFRGPVDPLGKMKEIFARIPNAEKKTYQYGRLKYNYTDFQVRLSQGFTIGDSTPDFLRQTRKETVHTFEQGTIELAPWAETVLYALDALAPDGKAIAFTPLATEINAHFYLEPYGSYFSKNNADLYVAVRVQKKADALPSGDIFEARLCNPTGDAIVASTKVSAEGLQDESYHWVKIENARINERMSVDLKVFENKTIEKVFVDKIVIVSRPL